MVRVARVLPDSIAEELGILPGTELRTVNGRQLDDFLDWEFLTADDELVIEARLPDGEEIVASMKRAVLTGPGVAEWYEMCFCSTPLHHERETQYDFYFTDMTGGPTARVAVSGMVPRDVEDVALGACPGAAQTCLWLGDIGDNARKRDTVTFVALTERADYPAEVAPLR